MQKEFVFSGFGGQGIMFVGQLLAYAAMDDGLYVTWIPSYGPEMRGGTAHCFVVVSDNPIGSPIVKHPKVAAVFNNPSLNKYEPLLASDGLLMVNSSLVTQKSKRDDIKSLYVPATEIAEEIGSAKVANLVLLGALLEAYRVLPLALVKRTLRKQLGDRKPALVEMNYRALEEGADYVRKLDNRSDALSSPDHERKA
jgi:2-oxoglutarate ferredoxin oxidoreductase subunit gamma